MCLRYTEHSQEELNQTRWQDVLLKLWKESVEGKIQSINQINQSINHSVLFISYLISSHLMSCLLLFFVVSPFCVTAIGDGPWLRKLADSLTDQYALYRNDHHLNVISILLLLFQLYFLRRRVFWYLSLYHLCFVFCLLSFVSGLFLACDSSLFGCFTSKYQRSWFNHCKTWFSIGYRW